MDEYSKRCIRYLLENDIGLLTKYVNGSCNSNVVLTGMNTDDIERIILDATLEKDVRIEESAITCRKCGKNTVIHREIQSRSADEGASVYYMCRSCYHRWTHR